MAYASFSNTHLRIPSGFGTLLEGLSREVLRDQPDDIPSYAARYFSALLMERNESGMDPVEWAATFEDKFYNNHAFKTRPTNKPSAKRTTSSEEKSSGSQTEDEILYPPTSSPDDTTYVHSTEIEAAEEKGFPDAEMEVSVERSNIRPQFTDASSGEHSGTEEENDHALSDQVDRTDIDNIFSGVTDKDTCQSELEPADFLSVNDNSNIDVCAEELGTAEVKERFTFDTHKTDDEDNEIGDSEVEEESAEHKETAEEYPYSGLADVCAEKLSRTQERVDVAVDDDDIDTHASELEISVTQMEGRVLQTPQSQSELAEGNTEATEDHDTEEKENNNSSEESNEIEPTADDTHDNSKTKIKDDLECDSAPEESFAEFSFEDVRMPEGIEQILLKDQSLLVPQSEVPDMESYMQFTELEANHDTQDLQGRDEPASEIDVVEQGDSAEGVATSLQEATGVAKEEVDTSDSDANQSDDEGNEVGEENISLSQQPSTETEEENFEGKSDIINDDHSTEETLNIESLQNKHPDIDNMEKETESLDPESEDDEKTDMGGDDLEPADAQSLSVGITHKVVDGGAEIDSSQIDQSYTSGQESESEEAPEETEARLATDVQLQQDHTEQEINSKLQVSVAEDDVDDTELEEDKDMVGDEGRVISSQNAVQVDDCSQEESRPHGYEKDTAEPEGTSRDEVTDQI